MEQGRFVPNFNNFHKHKTPPKTSNEYLEHIPENCLQLNKIGHFPEKLGTIKKNRLR